MSALRSSGQKRPFFKVSPTLAARCFRRRRSGRCSANRSRRGDLERVVVGLAGTNIRSIRLSFPASEDCWYSKQTIGQNFDVSGSSPPTQMRSLHYSKPATKGRNRQVPTLPLRRPTEAPLLSPGVPTHAVTAGGGRTTSLANRSMRARENAERSGSLSSMESPQNQR